MIMKMSNREKIMLYILGIILIGIGYYQFIYSVQMEKIDERIQKESQIKQKYNEAMNTIGSMGDRKSDVKILKAKIGDEALPFYPTISEEHIILELDKLLSDSGLKGGIKFDPIVSNSVENSKKEDKSLSESSIQGIVDKYDDVTGKNDNSESNSLNDSNKNTTNANNENFKSNDTKNNNNSSNNTNTSNSSSDNNNSKNSNTTNTNGGNSGSTNVDTSNSKDKGKNTVHYLKCAVSFEGSYDALNKLLNTIGKNEKKIVVNSLNVSEDTLDSIKGTLNLEIYSIPKINDELESYLKWDLKNTYGKSVPFSTGAASGNVQVNNDTNDFVASVRYANSDLPTVMVGKSDDPLKTSYVYGDSDLKEEVEMILTQDGDKYYCKYKTSNGKYPVNYDGLGAEFVPKSNNIVIDVLSQSRISSNDKSELVFKIINKTDKLVNVNVNGDDKSNPRVSVDGNGSNISVNQK
ncbi:hypothetical protein CLOSACC_11480 [Clostridium saccharobutylicum]|uniref:Type IV pilus assembly protein PilO n=3 Tax=Clostridium saccharobutylicum TaxID=169679 RepID=U5MMX2_CLOSA|nr:type IV pilus assembly protein PilO [Clostridium saccharobutylicum DSM 13864]AQR89439.1 hypothetical protein CLOSC_11400 [Clostridium saccharobutylicum]AQR99341.1 hypothetical protein CSACC_11480 [Clostridium saccharobutylicum]AQS13327.1 hypothetical protein CLOSACC_11480 [Clostridium saccharobutylicum]OAV38868.1 type IV pilus assembly protein PilO [Clostridium saccharobutylicum DSM 13864]